MSFFLDMFSGLLLGLFILFEGIFMDRFLSYDDYTELIKNKTTRQLYNEGIQTVKQNLLVLTPISYPIVMQTLISTQKSYFSVVDCILFICIHNFGYFCMHKLMHTHPKLYNFHSFHHRFDKILIPSIGNATSKSEFMLAYVIPAFIAGYVTVPNEITFVVSVYIISFFNHCIHCRPLQHVSWLPGFVTPLQHIQHHEYRNKHYSASIVNYDWIYE